MSHVWAVVRWLMRNRLSRAVARSRLAAVSYARLTRCRMLARLAGGTVVFGTDNAFAVPLRIAGHGSVQIGDRNQLGFSAGPRVGNGEILLQARATGALIAVGSRNAISNNLSVIANERITIGDDCQIGDGVAVYDCDFHELDPATRNRSAGPTAPVRIGNNVWLGSRTMILKGVTIGDNSVVGAMSVVTASIPPNSVVAGVPARILRSL